MDPHGRGDRMFRHAKARVYKVENNTNLIVVLEPPLKVRALEGILKDEVFRETNEGKKSSLVEDLLGGIDVIVLCKEEQTRTHVLTFLARDTNQARLPVMQRRFLNFMRKQVGSIQAVTPEQTLLQAEMHRLQALRDAVPLRAPFATGEAGEVVHPRHFLKDCSGPEDISVVGRSQQVQVHLMSDLSQHGLLDALRPRFVVLYDPDAAAMREVECYHASCVSRLPQTTAPTTMFMLYYEASMEEQKHLAGLNHERDAFVRVIQEKSELVFGSTADPVSNAEHSQRDVDITMVYDASSGQMVPASKKRRSGAQLGPSKVIVDLRELRSALPNMLHGSGFALDARMLEVGDYILSSEICVERKSIPDLVDSLKTGRLFKQCTMMMRHYKRPIVLIEFPDQGPFRLSSDQSEMTQIGLMSNIALLNIHFPEVRFLWSKSTRATVDLFRELQKNQPPPDGDLAESFEATGAGRLMTDVPNVEALEMLKRMPGVSKDNAYRIARGANSLAELCQLSIERLADICDGPNNARMLHEFLHEQ